jgi:hypothetical protein
VFAGSRPEISVSNIQIGTSTAPVTIGQSGDSTIVVASTGSAPLDVVSIVLGGPDAAEFVLTEDCTAAAVPRGEDCTITVTFTPTTPGTKSAEVQITTDDGTVTRAARAQSTVVVPIMAIAVAPPPPPPPPAGSQTNTPPAFATGDTGSAGACFIATAAYGSYLDPNVRVLREFRDRVLLRTRAGGQFVKFYYTHSPVLADFIARHDTVRTLTRWLLTPLVYALAYPLPALAVLGGLLALAVRRRRRFA